MGDGSPEEPLALVISAEVELCGDGVAEAPDLDGAPGGDVGGQANPVRSKAKQVRSQAARQLVSAAGDGATAAIAEAWPGVFIRMAMVESPNNPPK